MFTANKFAGAASLGGKIFVVGGVGTGDGYGYGMLYSGECYDPNLKIWTRIPIMADFGCEALAMDGAVFVALYGCDVLERYSPIYDTWEEVKVNNSAENNYEIWKICTLSKKYLPKNNNNK